MSTTTSPRSVVSLGNIRGFGKSDVGVFKISGDLFGWKNRKTGTVYQYKSSDIKSAEWIKTSPSSCQLKIYLKESKGNDIARFDGFQERNFREINSHFEEVFGQSIHHKKVATRGWHWGEYEIKNKLFSFAIDKKLAFEIIPSDVHQINVPAKTDIAIELKQEDIGPADDQLLEIRFYMPPKGDTDEVESQLDSIKQKLTADSQTENKGEMVALLTDVPLLLPRGRYEIDLGRKSIKFHGKSHDYTVQYKSITRMLLVPKPNSPHVNFVLGLDVAIRQGQTRYSFIVMQFETEAVTSVTVNMDDKELEDLKLERTLEGKVCDVVTRLFKAFVGRSIVVPGDFKSANDAVGVTCSYKAGSGHLYPLNRSLLFTVKPVLFIRYDDVLNVQFSHMPQNRYFSFIVSVRGGSEYEFTSIDRNEYQLLTDFLQGKGLRVKNIQPEVAATSDSLNAVALRSDESDEDFDAEDSEDDDYADKDEGNVSEDDGNDEEDEDDEDDDDDDDEEGEAEHVRKKVKLDKDGRKGTAQTI